MGATRETMRDRIRTDYAETGTAYTSDSEINRWIQEAHDLLGETGYYSQVLLTGLVEDQAEYDLSGLVGTSADMIIISLENVEFMNSATATAWRRLFPKPWWWICKVYDQIRDDASGSLTGWGSTGTPAYYCWHANHLYLYPVPSYTHADDGLRLTCKCAQLLDDDADETGLPRQFEGAITVYGLSKWHDKDGQPQIGMRYRQEFEQYSDRLWAWLNSNRSDEIERIAISGTERKVRVGG